MITIYANKGKASSLKDLIIDAANKEKPNSKYELETWRVAKLPNAQTNQNEDFIFHVQEQWGAVALFLVISPGDTIIVNSYYDMTADPDQKEYKSQKHHVEGRFVAALMSNMIDELKKVVFEKE